MLVSAISQNHNSVYNYSNNIPFVKKNSGKIADTSFNSLAPSNNKKSASPDEEQNVFENINEWKAFCEKQIAGGKLNIIA